jgi:transglutaminase/protease-like cytokinesis protein 3
MKKTALIFFYINIYFAITAETDYQYLEEYKKNTPSQDIKLLMHQLNTNPFSFRTSHDFLQKIADYIKNSSSNDYEKIKKVHDFVSLYLIYDYKAYKASIRPFFPKRIPDQSVNSTTLKRKAVCAGYSILFKYLCDAISIECLYVTGYARGLGWDPFLKEKLHDKKFYHAWNIVKIEDKSYLIDCTWDSVDIEDDEDDYIKIYSSEWLFVKPEHFIHTHFPENPVHQLLKQPKSFSDFNRLPYLRPEGIDYIKITQPTLTKIINANENEIFNIYLEDGDVIKFELYDRYGNKILNQITTNYMNSIPSVLNFYYWNHGKYLLEIYYYNTVSGKSFYVGCFGYIIGAYKDESDEIFWGRIDGLLK